MKASDLFIKCLEKEGVEYIFGVPGEENLDMLESLKDSSIELILTRHEQPAGFMAATIGRLTGKPGVCLSTLGPGATNFFTSAAYAQLGAMPMMMITGQKPIHSSKQGHFQIIDTVDMMRPITKYTKQIVHGNRIPTVIREAIKQSEAERPGAVHLELPEDVAAEETHAQPMPIHKVRRADANETAVNMAIEKIQAAKSPLFLIGAGANRKLISKRLSKLLNKTGIPFFNTQMGKGVIPEDHPLFLGTAALSDNDYLHCAIDKADLIINVGHDVVEKPPFFMKHGGTEVIHINFVPAEVDEVYFPQLEVVGDIANALWQIEDRIERNKDWDFSYFMKVKTAVDEKIRENADSDQFPMIPQRFVADVRAALGPEDIIALDNGVYKVWFARNYYALAPNTILLDNALATMGAGLPSAMAAKMVNPESTVVAICGDGGFMMNSQEIETCVRLKMNIIVLILNDSAYGMIKWKQAAMGFHNWGLDFGNPDFVKYAESYGANGHRIESTESFLPMLKDCAEKGGVHIIDLPVEYSENAKVLTEELKEKACIV
ncbi:MAG: acetolactate synthase large subunit [Gammaproteobacteria bacterium]